MKKKVLAILVVVIMVMALLPTAALAIPQTQVHVFDVPSGAATVVVNTSAYGDLPCTPQGGHWTTGDLAVFQTSNITGVTVDGVFIARAYLDIGVEGGGTVKITLPEQYLFTIDTTVTNGTITPDESGIPIGANRTINYSPNLGFHLVSVDVDGSPVSISTYPTSYSFTNIQADHTVVVVYEADVTFTIDTTVTNGTITPDESGIAAGSNRTITYSANAGYHLLSVHVDGSPVSIATYPTSYAFSSIYADHTVVVVYEADPTYTIDTTVTNGTITPDESGIAAGSTRTVTYSANLGFHLLSVHVDGSPVNIATYPTSVGFTNIQADHTVVVVYEADPTYAIDTTVTNGTITPDESGIAAGSDRTINYSPNAGFHMLSVHVDGSPVSIVTYLSSYSFTNIQANHTVVVVYEADPTYTIDTTVTNGTITPDESGIAAGANRTITYSPDPLHYLVSVHVDGSPVNIVTYLNSYSFTNIQANHTVVVVYDVIIPPEETYTIDTTVTNGTITPDETFIAAGSNRTITYSPDAGHYLVSVVVDGTPVSIVTYESSYSFTNIQADHTVVVVYDVIIPPEETYEIDTTVVNGVIDPDEAGILPGSNRTINYSPNAGHFLVSVTVNGSPVSIVTYQNSYAFTNIQENNIIVVVYGENVVTDTNTNLLLILCSILLLAGGALIALSRIKKKVREK